MSNCARNCWIFAAAMGLIVLMMSLGGVGFAGGLFLGFVTTWLLGGFLILLFCQGSVEDADWLPAGDVVADTVAPPRLSIRRDEGPVAQAPIARPLRPRGMAGAPGGAAAVSAQATTFVAADGRGVPARTGAAPASAASAGRGGWQVHGSGAPAGDDGDGQDDEDLPPADTITTAEGTIPRTGLARPRDGKGDDLSRIAGIGGKLTRWLNDNGIWHFDQIGAWTEQDVADWSARLGRKGGRIRKDEWVAQARALAEGAETAHARAAGPGRKK